MEALRQHGTLSTVPKLTTWIKRSLFEVLVVLQEAGRVTGDLLRWGRSHR